MEDLRQKINASIEQLLKWIEGHQYKGYEPFDGLSSYLRPLTLHRLLGERLLQQLIRQSPMNLRPLLGIRPQLSTKGMGYIAWGYLELFKVTGNDAYREKAFDCLDWLDKNKSPRYELHSWGNHFDYASRSGKLQKQEPTIVWTSLIGQVYLDAYELCGQKEHLEIISSIGKWILELPREETNLGTCLSYVKFMQSSIHNSNMLGAAFLSRAARHVGDKSLLDLARDAMRYSCSRQLPDGAWYYGEQSVNRWVDSFHTGYNLDSLKRYIKATGDRLFEENLEKAFYYFKGHFFEDNGRPRYYYNRTYPIDIQCASQAIDTLAYFSVEDSTSLKLAENVARWTIDNMQDADGHFYYRIYPLAIKAKVPMIHWAQATMFKALAHLLTKINN